MIFIVLAPELDDFEAGHIGRNWWDWAEFIDIILN